MDVKWYSDNIFLDDINFRFKVLNSGSKLFFVFSKEVTVTAGCTIGLNYYWSINLRSSGISFGNRYICLLQPLALFHSIGFPIQNLLIAKIGNVHIFIFAKT